MVGVLRDQPGVLGSPLSDERSSRPSDVGDDVPQAIGQVSLDDTYNF
jgi:hypothetical protein